MCGTLQLSATEKLVLAEGNLINKDLFIPNLKRDLPVSSHRFIRQERAAWWRSKCPIIKPVVIQAIGFYERGIYIPIPMDFCIAAVVHQALIDNHWVVSILTTDTEKVKRLPEVEEVRKLIQPIHHRMPILVRKTDWVKHGTQVEKRI